MTVVYASGKVSIQLTAVHCMHFYFQIKKRITLLSGHLGSMKHNSVSQVGVPIQTAFTPWHSQFSLSPSPLSNVQRHKPPNMCVPWTKRHTYCTQHRHTRTQMHVHAERPSGNRGSRDDLMSNIPLTFLGSKCRKRQGDHCLSEGDLQNLIHSLSQDGAARRK